jgi:hypothetical protein
MTNYLTESTSHVIHELLDDIKENIIQIHDHCRYLLDSMLFEYLFILILLYILAEQIQLNAIKPTNITNLLEKKLSSQDESTMPLILMNKQIELIHPLEHQWSFWYLKNQQGKDWQENLMKLASFTYVEEFWA